MGLAGEGWFGVGRLSYWCRNDLSENLGSHRLAGAGDRSWTGAEDVDEHVYFEGGWEGDDLVVTVSYTHLTLPTKA